MRDGLSLSPQAARCMRQVRTLGGDTRPALLSGCGLGTPSSNVQPATGLELENEARKGVLGLLQLCDRLVLLQPPSPPVRMTMAALLTSQGHCQGNLPGTAFTDNPQPQHVFSAPTAPVDLLLLFF